MTLENLVKIKQLNNELPDKKEFTGLVQAAVDRLTDSQNDALKFASRFDLAYSAAYGLALAALRAAGYRSDKRYLVFQCLAHTTDLSKTQNLAEYEGQHETDEQLLTELILNTNVLLGYVNRIKL